MEESLLEMLDVRGGGGSGAAADVSPLLEFAAVMLSEPDFRLVLRMGLGLGSSFGVRMRPGLDLDTGLRLGMCFSRG